MASIYCDEEVLPATLLMPIPLRTFGTCGRCYWSLLGELVDSERGYNGVRASFSVRVNSAIREPIPEMIGDYVPPVLQEAATLRMFNAMRSSAMLFNMRKVFVTKKFCFHT